jgi:hypothetical protein
MPYKILILDLFHYQDPENEYELGEVFATAEAAVTEAKRRLDAQVAYPLEPGTTVEEMVSDWMMFGDDPLVMRTDHTQPAADFSSSAYVRERATALVLAAEWQRWAELEEGV